MRKCHFCYEDIQDAAIRCKHCGADIGAAIAAAQQAKNDQSVNNFAGRFWGVVGALVFGALGFGAYTERLYTDIAICVGCGLVFLFLAPKAWQVGFLARNAGQPDIIIASSAGELAKQRFYYEYGARIFLTGGLFVALLGVPYFIGSLDRIFESGTPVAASSEAKSSSASAASDAQAVASATTGTEAQPVANGQDTATSEANAAIAASSSQATDVQPVNGSANTAGINPSTTPSSQTALEAITTNATDASSSVKTDPASVPSGIHASFDCNKASSKIEKLICSTPESGDADRRLAVAYAAARAKSNDLNALKADERSWLANERNACADAPCLVRVTNNRIARLSSM